MKIPKKWDYPAHIKAATHSRVHAAVQKGIIKKPSACESCKKNKSPQLLYGHHHKGYGEPLEVKWLCPKCHSVEHAMQKGSNHPNHRLSESDIPKICEDYRNGLTLSKVGSKWGIDLHVIERIVHNRCWQHVKREPVYKWSKRVQFRPTVH